MMMGLSNSRRRRPLVRRSANIDMEATGPTKRRTRSDAKADSEEMRASITLHQQQQAADDADMAGKVTEDENPPTRLCDVDQPAVECDAEVFDAAAETYRAANTIVTNLCRTDAALLVGESNTKTALPMEWTGNDELCMQVTEAESPRSSKVSAIEGSSVVSAKISIEAAEFDVERKLLEAPVQVEELLKLRDAVEVEKSSLGENKHDDDDDEQRGIEDSGEHCEINDDGRDKKNKDEQHPRLTQELTETPSTVTIDLHELHETTHGVVSSAAGRTDVREMPNDNEEKEVDYQTSDSVVEERQDAILPRIHLQTESEEDFIQPRRESTNSLDGGHQLEDLTSTNFDANIQLASVSDDDETSTSPQQPANPTRPPPQPPAATLLFAGDGPPVPVVRVTCGSRRADFHVDRLVDGLGPVANSVGTSRSSLCVRTVDDDEDGGTGTWMTPNQFQRACGRGTARDWKRSIKHHGVSLKSLMSKAILLFNATSPGCRCNICTGTPNLLHKQSISTLKVGQSDNASRKRLSTGEDLSRPHRKQAKSDVVRQMMTSPGSPESRDSLSDDADTDVTDSVDSLPSTKVITMSNIIQELRSNKRQLTEKSDVSRRHGTTTTSLVTDNNNNDEDSYSAAVTLSQMHSTTSPTTPRWTPHHSAITPTSAALPRTSQSRSRRRRHHQTEPCYDHFGALDLTAAGSKRAARPSNSASRRLSTAAASATRIPDDSLPMDLSMRRHFSSSSVTEDRSSIQTTSSTFCGVAQRVSLWTVPDVANFVSIVPGCGTYAENFLRLSIEGSTLAAMSIDRMSSELGMRRDAAEMLRFAVDRILATPLS